MMKHIEDGGPAFPSRRVEKTEIHDGVFIDVEVRYSGMSLRDWFAGQALANLYTHTDENADKVAEWAYQVADAMLDARTK